MKRSFFNCHVNGCAGRTTAVVVIYQPLSQLSSRSHHPVDVAGVQSLSSCHSSCLTVALSLQPPSLLLCCHPYSPWLISNHRCLTPSPSLRHQASLHSSHRHRCSGVILLRCHCVQSQLINGYSVLLSEENIAQSSLNQTCCLKEMSPSRPCTTWLP